MKALPIRLLLIAGLWMPMAHSHAPEWMQVVRDGGITGMLASVDGVPTGTRAEHDAHMRHSIEADHDHCPVCALQMAGLDLGSPYDRPTRSALDLVLGDAVDNARSRLHVSYSGRAPPRLV